jgi:hypothetical protein
MTWQVSTRFRLGYVARYQTREIRTGAGNRELFWAGLIINRDL